MKKELIINVFDAFVDFVGACAKDVVAPDESEAAEAEVEAGAEAEAAEAKAKEYTIFDGSLKADKEGNIKVYSKSNDLVSQTPVRKILTNFKNLGHSVISLIDQDEKDRKAEAEAEAKEEADRQEAANKEVDAEIEEHLSKIEGLKLRKKAVRHYVKKLSFD